MADLPESISKRVLDLRDTNAEALRNLRDEFKDKNFLFPEELQKVAKLRSICDLSNKFVAHVVGAPKYFQSNHALDL